jgi:DNA-binding MarR family transcriptional regulator
LGDVLERIEAKGLVVRSTSPSDRRVKLLSLSAEGRKLLAEVSMPVQRVQKRLLEPLTSKEQQIFLELLSRLTESHKDLPPIKS